MQKKITKATFKSFIRKNEGKIFIRSESSFDGMTDCVQQVSSPQFNKAEKADHMHDNNFGIRGVWLVGGSRDYFDAYNDNGFVGFRVHNCCGSFVVAVRD